jgi:hypothetical protein
MISMRAHARKEMVTRTRSAGVLHHLHSGAFGKSIKWEGRGSRRRIVPSPLKLRWLLRQPMMRLYPALGFDL